MKHIRVALFLAGMAVLCCSCRKDPIELDNPNSPSASVQTTLLDRFELLWHGMDNGYVFWSHDTVDWDARYAKYRPVFEELSANANVTWQELQPALDGLMEGLVDHHLYAQLIAPNGASAYTSPGNKELHARPYYHYTDRAAQVAALSSIAGVDSLMKWDGDDYTPGNWACVFPGSRAGKKIAYFRLSGFSVSSMWNMRSQLPNKVSSQAPIKAFYGTNYGNGVNATGWVTKNHVEALILDLRANGGGNAVDLELVGGSLTQSSTTVGYTRVKEGPGRLDMGAWCKFYIRTPEGHLATAKPIVVLADCNSASCAELTTLLIKTLPNGTFIGDRTMGATCALTPGAFNTFHSGCFGDAFKYGYYVYTSTYDMVGLDHKSLEGVGVTPDIEVPYDAAQLAQGHDTQLERAIDYLREKCK